VAAAWLEVVLLLEETGTGLLNTLDDDDWVDDEEGELIIPVPLPGAFVAVLLEGAWTIVRVLFGSVCATAGKRLASEKTANAKTVETSRGSKDAD